MYETWRRSVPALRIKSEAQRSATKWVCTKIEPIPPRFCQSDAASDNFRRPADCGERMNLYGDALSLRRIGKRT